MHWKVALLRENLCFLFAIFIFFCLNISDGCQKLKQLLSFAIGGLLGDVFLHLLPEAWAKAGPSGDASSPRISHVLLDNSPDPFLTHDPRIFITLDTFLVDASGRCKQCRL